MPLVIFLDSQISQILVKDLIKIKISKTLIINPHKTKLITTKKLCSNQSKIKNQYNNNLLCNQIYQIQMKIFLLVTQSRFSSNKYKLMQFKIQIIQFKMYHKLARFKRLIKILVEMIYQISWTTLVSNNHQPIKYHRTNK